MSNSNSNTMTNMLINHAKMVVVGDTTFARAVESIVANEIAKGEADTPELLALVRECLGTLTNGLRLDDVVEIVGLVGETHFTVHASDASGHIVETRVFTNDMGRRGAGFFYDEVSPSKLSQEDLFTYCEAVAEMMAAKYSSPTIRVRFNV